MFRAVFSACLIGGLVAALALFGAGIYMAITKRTSPGPEDRLDILGLFSIRTHGDAVGLVFAGLVLIALCLILVSRLVSR
jgi:hypothetical protein